MKLDNIVNKNYDVQLQLILLFFFFIYLYEKGHSSIERQAVFITFAFTAVVFSFMVWIEERNSY